MSDIFVSYSSKDRPWVERFAQTLETRGWSVWWDRNIPTGDSFNAVIRRELSSARCAIVVWSDQSVESEWVQAEAAEAKKQEKYLPIKINESEIPLGFTQRTYQSLVDWEAGVEHVGFSQLLKDIERLVKSPQKQVEYRLKPWWKRIPPLWLVASPAILASAVAVSLMLWPVSARVQVELTTERVEFVLGAKQSQNSFTLSGMVADSVGIENFEAIMFMPSTIEVADPLLYQLREDSFPDKAWRKLGLAESELTLAANHHARLSRVVLEGKGEPIKLDAIVVMAGARVSLETRAKEKKELREEKNKKETKEKTEKREGVTIKVAGQNKAILRPSRKVTVITEHVEVHGLKDLPFKQDGGLTYRVTLPKPPSHVTVSSWADELVLLPTFILGQSPHEVFGGIPVTMIDFTRQASEADGGRQTYVQGGARISALTGNGTITFPGYEDLLGRVPIEKDEAVGLEHLDGFTIQELSLTANGSGIYLKGEGMATEIRTKAGQIPIQSHGLNMMEALWHNARLAMVATIMATVLTTSLGVYRLWKDLRR